VVLRRAVKADLALSRKTKGEQIELLMPDKDVQAWEYAVLVTNSTYALEIFGQLYRDRADCENGFDELKNQWGWGGFTTQDIEGSVALPVDKRVWGRNGCQFFKRDGFVLTIHKTGRQKTA
jgi:hypothetical protein